jgi:hypothetical protein
MNEQNKKTKKVNEQSSGSVIGRVMLGIITLLIFYGLVCIIMSAWSYVNRLRIWTQLDHVLKDWPIVVQNTLVAIILIGICYIIGWIIIRATGTPYVESDHPTWYQKIKHLIQSSVTAFQEIKNRKGMWVWRDNRWMLVQICATEIAPNNTKVYSTYEQFSFSATGVPGTAHSNDCKPTKLKGWQVFVHRITGGSTFAEEVAKEAARHRWSQDIPLYRRPHP